MDNKTARNYFLENKAYKVLRYISCSFLLFGIFSCIFLWSGVEIGTPFLVVGGVLYWFVSSKTVNGKNYLHQAEEVLSEELSRLEELMSSKERISGSVATSKQFVFGSSSYVKKAAKDRLVSSCAQVTVIYCNEKANRIHVAVTDIDFLEGRKNTAEAVGNLSDSHLTKDDYSYTKLGCSKKQVKASLTLLDKTYELVLNDDYTTHKFIDDYFINRRV